MKILRAPSDKVLVIISEPEGVTDEDISKTLAASEAFRSLFTAVKGECEGIVPLGAPSNGLDGITHVTAILMPAPSVLWFQAHPHHWEWAEGS